MHFLSALVGRRPKMPTGKCGCGFADVPGSPGERLLGFAVPSVQDRFRGGSRYPLTPFGRRVSTVREAMMIMGWPVPGLA
jgi:hypothetical protein